MKETNKSSKRLFKRDFTGHVSGGPRTRAKKINKSCFGNLAPRSIYWDPLGKKSKDHLPFDMRKEMYQNQKKRLEEFDYFHVQRGFSPNDAIDMIRKQVIQTGEWTLPVHILPTVRVVNPQRTPMADYIPRISIDKKDVDVTARTTHNEDDVEWDLDDRLDPAVFADARYSYASPTRETYEFEAVDYGLAEAVTNAMNITSRTVRDASSEAYESLARSIRIAEENAIIYGGDAAAYSDECFNGFSTLGTEDAEVDFADVEVSHIEELIDSGLEAGMNEQSSVIVTNFTTYRNLRTEMREYLRYNKPDADINFGISTFEIENIPVYRSHAMDTTDADKMGAANTVFVDFDSTYMAMVADMNIDPLAKIGPAEDIAVWAYGTLVSETGTTDADHIQYISDT